MARTEIAGGEGSSSTRSRAVRRGHEEGGKYARYTEEQIEILEKVYAQCSNPNHVQRAQIMREEPLLSGIDNKQLKVWFQNRRCRERQKKENSNLVSENKRLASSNKLLREENDGLQKKLSQLIRENEQLRNQVLSLTSTITTFDMGHQPEANNPQLPIRIADNNNGLLLLAEETKKEFLSKAFGTAINWIHVPWLKMHNPGSVGAFYVSSNCTGVAARGIATIPFEPTKTIDILKNRPTWSRHCRNMDVVAKHPANNGGSIELIYTQYYAPTPLAYARDFWTLRYTCGLDDGSFLVCERSISSSDTGPSSPVALEFVRGMMLPSGYLIRPTEGGSTIYMVDHLDLEASSVPKVVRPLYEAPEFVAKRMIVSALHYIEHVDNEMHGRITIPDFCQEPAYLRPYGEKLSKWFNDAVNCFSEDGWTLMNGDASDDVIMSIKRARHSGHRANYDSVICVKASVLLQNVFPASLVKYLKEHRADWMDFNFADHSVAFDEAACFAYPGRNTHNIDGYPVVIAKTNHEDEAMEVVQFQRTDRPYLWDIYHLQINNGMEDTGFGTCSELIFAPIDTNLPDDAVLFSSGFRFILLGSYTDPRLASNWTFNLMNGDAAGSYPPTMMILAFQFPFEAPLQKDVTPMARQYVQHVISSVKRISTGMMPPGLNRELNSNANPVRYYRRMNYPQANLAPVQNISGVMPSGPYPRMNSTQANTDSTRNFFATYPGMNSAGANMASVQNIFASYPIMNSTGASTALVQNAGGVMPSGLYPVMSSNEANPASMQNISGGVMPSGSYSVLNMNCTEANPASMQNISVGLMASGSYPTLNSNEANPDSMQNISGGTMLWGSYPGMNSVTATPAIVKNISSGIVPAGSNPESNFPEANPVPVENTSGGITASGSNTEMNFAGANPGVQNITGGIMPSRSFPEMNSIEANPAIDFRSTPESTYAANLANLMCQSYRLTLGVDMLGFNSQQTTESIAEMVRHHPYAILCFSFTSFPVCLYANQAALNMLETTVDNLPTLTVDRILDGTHTLSLFSILPTVMQQGYIILPPGQCMSVMNHFIAYEQAVIWQVRTPDGSVHSLALACINWSFI